MWFITSCFIVLALYYLPYHDSIRYNQNVILPNSINIVVSSYTIFFIIPIVLLFNCLGDSSRPIRISLAVVLKP
jgi:hypothetical protein